MLLRCRSIIPKSVILLSVFNSFSAELWFKDTWTPVWKGQWQLRVSRIKKKPSRDHFLTTCFMYGIFRVRTFALTSWNTRSLYFNVAYCHVMYTTRCTPFGHTFQKKKDVTKSRTVLDIVFSSVESFFLFSRRCDIYCSFGDTRPDELHWSMRKIFPQQGTKRVATRWNVTCVWLRIPNIPQPGQTIFQTCSVELFDSTEPKKIRQISLWT